MVIDGGIGDRLRDEGECGKVHHGLDCVLAHRRLEHRPIVNGGIDEWQPLDRRLVPVRQIVIDPHVVSPFDQTPRGLTADVTGTPRHQHPHEITFRLSRGDAATTRPRVRTRTIPADALPRRIRP